MNIGGTVYENRKSKSVEVSIGFTQGMVAAICILIKIEGLVTSAALELWSGCSARGKTVYGLKEYGIDEMDIETLIQYKLVKP